MNTINKSVLSSVKSGDTVQIVPISKVPDAEREFKVNEVLANGFLYGLSGTCDGYIMPFDWIEEIRIVKRGN